MKLSFPQADAIIDQLTTRIHELIGTDYRDAAIDAASRAEGHAIRAEAAADNAEVGIRDDTVAKQHLTPGLRDELDGKADRTEVPTTAADVGARPDTWTPTAEEVGARPDTWTPTAADVGAREASWTPTAQDVGARPADWVPTAAQVGARPDTWTPTAADVGAATQSDIDTALENFTSGVEQTTTTTVTNGVTAIFVKTGNTVTVTKYGGHWRDVIAPTGYRPTRQALCVSPQEPGGSNFTVVTVHPDGAIDQSALNINADGATITYILI